MARTPYKQRIAHGALLVAYASRCSTMILEQSPPAADGAVPVSLGYDRIRFLKPVFIGDTVALTYTIRSVDAARRRTVADVAITNQAGETVAVLEHIMKWVA
jgi:acyl dehydratase